MQITTKFIMTTILSSTLLSGCASLFLDVKPGSEKVAVVDAKQVSGCESKGSVTFTVLSKLWFVNRGEKDVEENLLQMARNSAVEDNADTIVKGESKKFGERAYALYKCR
ncbi:Protein of unknown function DUF4156 [Methylophilaceae bacterium]|jgi:hypothetical protein